MPGARPGIDFLLEPYRVLALTDERGLLAGKILADMGADVLQIEPPGGSPARNLGPFYGDDPHPEKKLVLVGLCCKQAEYHPGPRAERRPGAAKTNGAESRFFD